MFTFIIRTTDNPASKTHEVEAERVELAPNPVIPHLIRNNLIHLAMVVDVTCL
jgi:hypothetical protein